MTADESNAAIAEIDAQIDSLVGARALDPGLRLALVQAATRRARQGLAWWTEDFTRIVSEFAE